MWNEFPDMVYAVMGVGRESIKPHQQVIFEMQYGLP